MFVMARARSAAALFHSRCRRSPPFATSRARKASTSTSSVTTTIATATARPRGSRPTASMHSASTWTTRSCCCHPRSAEAVDSILNAANSGSPDVPNTMNAGRILCSICQLGGLIYFTLLGIIVLVLINFLPLINFIFTLLFDGCVTCIDLTTTAEGRKKVKAGVSIASAAAKTAAQNAKRARQGGAGSSGVKKVGASGGDPGAFDANDVHLTAQQVRSLKRARRAQRAEMRRAAGVPATDASWTQRLRRLGARIVHLGEPPAPLQEGRSLLKPQADTVSPPASPPPPSPRGPPQETWA